MINSTPIIIEKQAKIVDNDKMLFHVAIYCVAVVIEPPIPVSTVTSENTLNGKVRT